MYMHVKVYSPNTKIACFGKQASSLMQSCIKGLLILALPYASAMLLLNIGALHMGPWIRIRCGQEIRIQRPLCLHTASIRIRAACDPVKQCNTRSLCAVWSSHATTLNLDRGSVSSKSVFSAYVESPIDLYKSLVVSLALATDHD